jgi:phospholipid/cholesterol/gamma-HCH transport system permease protein
LKAYLYVLGEQVYDSLTYVGGVFTLLGRIHAALPSLLKRFKLTVEQMSIIGVNSLPLVAFTSVFTGMVASVQAMYQIAGKTPVIYLGYGVCKAVIIELGPVLTALVVAGRVGASIAAELGTMRVTEQIDAMESLALDPIEFLVLPRFVAAAIMLPVLVVFADFVAIVGGGVVAVLTLRVEPQVYLDGLRLYFSMRDVFGGLLKSAVFGMIIATMGCYHGFTTGGGAEGVGRATTRAVVASSLLILVCDYLVATTIFRT